MISLIGVCGFNAIAEVFLPRCLLKSNDVKKHVVINKYLNQVITIERLSFLLVICEFRVVFTASIVTNTNTLKARVISVPACAPVVTLLHSTNILYKDWGNIDGMVQSLFFFQLNV